VFLGLVVLFICMYIMFSEVFLNIYLFIYLCVCAYMMYLPFCNAFVDPYY